MEQMKTKRIERERKGIAINVLRAYKIPSLPWTDLMPEPVDFCAFPEIKAILQLSNDVDVDESTFSDILPKFPEMFDRWRGNIHRLLVVKFRKAQKDQLRLSAMFGSSHFTASPSIHASDEEIFENMRLATTVFKCLNCDETPCIAKEVFDRADEDPLPACRHFWIGPDHSNPLFYPKVLGHHCLTIQAPNHIIWEDIPARCYPDPSVRLDMLTQGCHLESHRKQWVCHCLVVDAHAGKMVERIVEACGFDATQTTAEEMDYVDARLACMNCATRHSKNTTEVSVFAWRSAVSTLINCKESHANVNGLQAKAPCF
jgi:hypothetical protein